jgi:hypothetical protein
MFLGVIKKMGHLFLIFFQFHGPEKCEKADFCAKNEDFAKKSPFGVS